MPLKWKKYCTSCMVLLKSWFCLVHSSLVWLMMMLERSSFVLDPLPETITTTTLESEKRLEKKGLKRVFSLSFFLQSIYQLFVQLLLNVTCYKTKTTNWNKLKFKFCKWNKNLPDGLPPIKCFFKVLSLTFQFLC